MSAFARVAHSIAGVLVVCMCASLIACSRAKVVVNPLYTSEIWHCSSPGGDSVARKSIRQSFPTQIDVEPMFDFQALVNRVQYPESARSAGLQGLVQVAVLIDENGSQTDLCIIETGHDVFIEAAVRAVQATNFHAATSNGKPVRCWVRIPVNFRLRG